MRAEWAKQEYNQQCKMQTHSRKHEITETEGGKHLALARIAWLEGGGAQGMQAAAFGKQHIRLRGSLQAVQPDVFNCILYTVHRRLRE